MGVWPVNPFKCFKECFMGGSIQVIKDILFSERDKNARLSNNGRASYI